MCFPRSSSAREEGGGVQDFDGNVHVSTKRENCGFELCPCRFPGKSKMRACRFVFWALAVPGVSGSVCCGRVVRCIAWVLRADSREAQRLPSITIPMSQNTVCTYWRRENSLLLCVTYILTLFLFQEGRTGTSEKESWRFICLVWTATMLHICALHSVKIRNLFVSYLELGVNTCAKVIQIRVNQSKQTPLCRQKAKRVSHFRLFDQFRLGKNTSAKEFEDLRSKRFFNLTLTRFCSCKEIEIFCPKTAVIKTEGKAATFYGVSCVPPQGINPCSRSRQRWRTLTRRIDRSSCLSVKEL